MKITVRSPFPALTFHSSVLRVMLHAILVSFPKSNSKNHLLIRNLYEKNLISNSPLPHGFPSISRSKRGRLSVQQYRQLDESAPNAMANLERY